MQQTQQTQSTPILSIIGAKIALGPRCRELIPLAARWYNDFEIMRTYGNQFRLSTLERFEEMYARNSSGGTDFVDFAIYEQATLRLIGQCGLEQINHFDRTAKYTILIGEKDCWNRGFGTETTQLVLDYGFTCLGLHNLYLTVYSFNQRGLNAYRRAGFKEIGRQREACRLGGKAHDVIYMDCLATEFQSPVLANLLVGDEEGGHNHHG